MMRRAALLLALLAAPAWADSLEFPAAVERQGVVAGVYRAERTGAGTLEVEWTDALGRLVQRERRDIAEGEGSSLPIRLDAGRAAAMENTVRARLVRGGVAGEAELKFIARPRSQNWDDFQTIMYQDHPPSALNGLREVGVTGVKVLGRRVPFVPADVARQIAPALGADFRWYVENIATDFYSPYHMWTPEHPNLVHWRFLDVQARHRRDPSDLSVFERSPSLSDPEWMARIRARLGAHVRAHGDYRPFYYALGDEPGIADLAAAWDFDRSPVALAAFREWLKKRYHDVGALNAMWGSGFARWEDVVPEGTTAAMARGDGNYAAWNDHKAFMDASFAAALLAGTEAIHAADPGALSGIEGGQIPGWGGWDYGQVAPAVDVMEIYEAGQNVEIARSLNPNLVILATTFETGANEQRRLWRSVLKGARGFIIWDEADDVVGADGRPGKRGASEAGFWRELRDGLGALLIASRIRYDAVAVLYSPESFRLSWLLQHAPRGDAWTERNSEKENEDTVVRVAMRKVAGELAALGLQPRWVTPGMVAGGGLDGVKLLILPQAMALSDAEIAGIEAFRRGGGTVLADGPAGAYDGNLRRREAPVEGIAVPVSPEAIMRATGVAPRAAGVTIRSNGAMELWGRDGAAANATLPAPAYMRDVRQGGAWQRADRIRFPPGPALVAIAPAVPPVPTLAGPAALRAGETALLRLGLSGPTPAEATVLHVEVRDPAGRVVLAYSGNAILRGDAEEWRVPFALNDPAGTWAVSVRDVAGGAAAALSIAVEAP